MDINDPLNTAPKRYHYDYVFDDHFSNHFVTVPTPKINVH